MWQIGRRLTWNKTVGELAVSRLVCIIIKFIFFWRVFFFFGVRAVFLIHTRVHYVGKLEKHTLKPTNELPAHHPLAALPPISMGRAAVPPANGAAAHHGPVQGASGWVWWRNGLFFLFGSPKRDASKKREKHGVSALSGRWWITITNNQPKDGGSGREDVWVEARGWESVWGDTVPLFGATFHTMKKYIYIIQHRPRWQEGTSPTTGRRIHNNQPDNNAYNDNDNGKNKDENKDEDKDEWGQWRRLWW